MSALAVYIHIPFCKTLCPYCDFIKEPAARHAPDEYVDALCKEIGACGYENNALSVFFGGGTPSLLSEASLNKILDTLRASFDLSSAEVTLEANPDDVTRELIAIWRKAGVNRISLGVQSFDDDALRYLGRRHDADAARRACDAVAASFDSWNMDLMFGAHPAGTWETSLTGCIGFEPPHVSAYGLTYEEGTPFGKRADEAIDDETYLSLYRETVDALSAAGIQRYEVSNFARPGFESQHNLVYWRNEAYSGFGTGAYGYVGGVRARNATKTPDYVGAPGEKVESLVLTLDEEKVETLIQHLRLANGIARSYYSARFADELVDDFGETLAALDARGLVEWKADHVVPTDLGFKLNNEIGIALAGGPARPATSAR